MSLYVLRKCRGPGINKTFFFKLFLLVVSKNCGDLSLVRVGRKSHIHPSVMKFSLDSLTKEVKERQTVVSAVGDLSSIREKLKIYEHREKELDIEILELKNSPFPDNNTKVSFCSFWCLLVTLSRSYFLP